MPIEVQILPVAANDELILDQGIRFEALRRAESPTQGTLTAHLRISTAGSPSVLLALGIIRQVVEIFEVHKRLTTLNLNDTESLNRVSFQRVLSEINGTRLETLRVVSSKSLPEEISLAHRFFDGTDSLLFDPLHRAEYAALQIKWEQVESNLPRLRDQPSGVFSLVQQLVRLVTSGDPKNAVNSEQAPIGVSRNAA